MAGAGVAAPSSGPKAPRAPAWKTAAAFAVIRTRHANRPTEHSLSTAMTCNEGTVCRGCAQMAAQRLCAWRTFGIVLQRLLHDCNACSRHASRAAAPRVAASGILRSWGWVSTGSKISPVVGACVAGEFPPGPCALSPGSLKSCLRCAHTLRHQIARATSAAFRLFAFAKGFGADATSLASAKCCKCAVAGSSAGNQI